MHAHAAHAHASHRRMWAELTERAGADVTHGVAEAVADRFYITPEETRAAKRQRRAAGAGTPTVDGCVSCVHGKRLGGTVGEIGVHKGSSSRNVGFTSSDPLVCMHTTCSLTVRGQICWCRQAWRFMQRILIAWPTGTCDMLGKYRMTEFQHENAFTSPPHEPHPRSAAGVAMWALGEEGAALAGQSINHVAI